MQRKFSGTDTATVPVPNKREIPEGTLKRPRRDAFSQVINEATKFAPQARLSHARDQNEGSSQSLMG
jgi:hypothetical protein